jgi:hypothetical protein
LVCYALAGRSALLGFRAVIAETEEVDEETEEEDF